MMPQTLPQTMLVVWTRFHHGESEAVETIAPLLYLRQQARQAEYARYYRQVEKLAEELESRGITRVGGPDSSPRQTA